MSRLAVCEKCKKLYEYKPEIRYEGGITYSTVKCEHCGHIKESNKNHIHYGNDEIKH